MREETRKGNVRGRRKMREETRKGNVKRLIKNDKEQQEFL